MLRNRRTNLPLALAQRRFRIDAEMARDIRHDEKQIAELLGNPLLARAFAFALGDRRFQLGDLFLGLGEHGAQARPVEADLSRALLKFHGAGESRKRDRHVIQPRRGRSRSARGLLLGLDPLPHISAKKLIAACVAEHVRVSPDHLAGDRINHVGEFEPLQLGRHLRVVNHLKQQVAKLVLQRIEIVARDRLGDLVGFLDRIRRDARKGLLDVPRAARVLVAQARHDGEQIGERVGLRARRLPGLVSHGTWRGGGAQRGAPLRANSCGHPRG